MKIEGYISRLRIYSSKRATPSLWTLFRPISGINNSWVCTIVSVYHDGVLGSPGTMLNLRFPDPLPAAIGGLNILSAVIFFFVGEVET